MHHGAIDDSEQPDAAGQVSSDHEIPPALTESIKGSLRLYRRVSPYLETVAENTREMRRLIALAEPFQVQARQLESALAQITAVQVGGNLAGLMPQAEVWQAMAARLLPAFQNLSSTVDLIPKWLPANWEGEPDLDLDAAMILINAGLPLIWVPRAAIVASLVSAADDAGREAILAASLAEVSEDCENMLTQVTRLELRDLAVLACEAADVLALGKSAASQALASSVFDTWLREASRRETILQPLARRRVYEKLRNQIEPLSDETWLTELRQVGVLAPALAALQDFRPSDPAPATYSRQLRRIPPGLCSSRQLMPRSP